METEQRVAVGRDPSSPQHGRLAQSAVARARHVTQHSVELEPLARREHLWQVAACVGEARRKPRAHGDNYYARAVRFTRQCRA